MAEYWKSTPKYWCKFCSVFVKDTKFEKQQHEATGRHQGNIQRSLKGLHREQQNQAREQQRAKDEVARLKGQVSGSASTPAPAPGSTDLGRGSSANAHNDARVGAKPTFTRADGGPGTLEDRKRQINQLAAMGVAVPEEMRRDMAMAGDWHVVSERVIGGDGEEDEKKSLSTGVHKRKIDEAEEERIAAEEMVTKHRGWGKTFKSFPGKMGGGDDDDVESLFKKGKKKSEVKTDPVGKEETRILKEEDDQSALKDIPTTEEDDATASTDSKPVTATADEAIKQENEESAIPAVVFKKRKKIAR